MTKRTGSPITDRRFGRQMGPTDGIPIVICQDKLRRGSHLGTWKTGASQASLYPYAPGTVHAYVQQLKIFVNIYISSHNCNSGRLRDGRLTGACKPQLLCTSFSRESCCNRKLFSSVDRRDVRILYSKIRLGFKLIIKYLTF